MLSYESQTEESKALSQEIKDLKKERNAVAGVNAEIFMVWDVFDHFPMIKDFIFEIGRRLKNFIPVPLHDVVDLFKEKVLGQKEQEQVRGRSR